MERPAKKNFTSRIGLKFQAVAPAEASGGEWMLASVKPLPSPNTDELGDLECFTLIFSHNCERMLPQGLYTLTGEDGFQASLFASPFQDQEMVVTVN